MVGSRSAPHKVYITCSLSVCENKHSQGNISSLQFFSFERRHSKELLGIFLKDFPGVSVTRIYHQFTQRLHTKVVNIQDLLDLEIRFVWK